MRKMFLPQRFKPAVQGKQLTKGTLEPKRYTARPSQNCAVRNVGENVNSTDVHSGNVHLRRSAAMIPRRLPKSIAKMGPFASVESRASSAPTVESSQTSVTRGGGHSRSARHSASSESSPRAPQEGAMPPVMRLATKPRLKPRTVESGASASGLPGGCAGSLPVSMESGELSPGREVLSKSAVGPGPIEGATPKRTRRRISPDEVRATAQASCDAEHEALGEAEAMWQMFEAPVYWGHECPEEEFSASAIRFAPRGRRWIGLAQVHGVSLTNRRFRAELRARRGYGKLKNPDAPNLLGRHGEYGRSMSRYLGD